MATRLPSQGRRKRINKLWATEAHHCFFCTSPFFTKHEVTLDHLTPLGRGGTNAYHNLVLACKDCNHAKADMTLAEFVDFVAGYGGIEYVKENYGFGKSSGQVIRVGKLSPLNV